MTKYAPTVFPPWDARNNFSNEAGIRQAYIDQAKTELQKYGLTQENTKLILEKLEWVHA